MPAAANIVINDGESTPVAHTFTPSKISDLVAVMYGPGNTLATRERITLTKRESTATVAGKLSIKLELPVEQTVDGQVILGYQQTAFMEFVVAPKSTKQNRKNTRVLSSNLLNNLLIAQVIDDGDFLF